MAVNEPSANIWGAAKEGCLMEVQRVVETGIAVDARDKAEATPLHYAAEHGHLGVVAWLLDHGANVNAKTKSVPGERQGSTPLHEAIMCARNEQIVELLLTHGSKVNLKMSDGATPLILAAEQGSAAIAELLLNRDADVNLCDQMGNTPLTAALLGGHFDLARMLLKHGSNVNHPLEPFEGTPLIMAAGGKFLEAVRFLLAAGADVHAQDGRGQTALHATVVAGSVQVTKHEWNEGHYAVTEDNPEHALAIAKELLLAGIDPSVRDNDGMTALAWAKKLRLLRMVELMECGT